MSDYLFEKTGEDPEIERLEEVLRPLAYRGAPPKLPRRTPVWIPSLLAAAAALVLVVWTLRPRAPEWHEGPATLKITSIGQVQLSASTRARFLEPEKLELAHGTLSAHINAPPRRFSVKTKFMTVIDLGCAFELTVDDEGRGKLIVTEGKVALSDGTREVVVPAGGESSFDEHGALSPRLPHASAPQPAEAVKPTPKLVPKKPLPKTVEPQKKAPKSEPKKSEPEKKIERSEPNHKNGSRFDHNTLDDLESSAR